MNLSSFPYAFNLVFFGGSGDLVTRKLLPALYQCFKNRLLTGKGHIHCLGLEPYSQDEFVRFVEAKAKDFIPRQEWDDVVWALFVQMLAYDKLDATCPGDYDVLNERLALKDAEVNVFYLSTASFLFAPICENLKRKGLNGANSRVVLEKPLGHDLASSNAITETVSRFFQEKQIYRIDHYLGKESVQNLMALRFGNTLFEPLWRREWIRNVQITIAEQVGIGTRSGFYDKAGALRDMVQNHLVQLLCFVAMEPPSSLESNAVRNEKLKVLESLIPFNSQDVQEKTVRGQYSEGVCAGHSVKAYRAEEGIPEDSKTETFVALKAEIANWRWAGVPFYLRTGKRMHERLAEIVINFREVPHPIFPMTHAKTSHARLEIRLQPNEYIRLYLNVKPPGDTMELQQVYLDLNFADKFKVRPEGGYERLLLDVIRGNQALFVRQDELEQAWRWVEPILHAWSADDAETRSAGLASYTAGSWGPRAASELIAKDGFCWHEEELGHD